MVVVVVVVVVVAVVVVPCGKFRSLEPAKTDPFEFLLWSSDAFPALTPLVSTSQPHPRHFSTSWSCHQGSTLKRRRQTAGRLPSEGDTAQLPVVLSDACSDLTYTTYTMPHTDNNVRRVTGPTLTE